MIFEPTQLTFFGLVWLLAIAAGAIGGAVAGKELFGAGGAIAGGIIGFVVGHTLGGLPSFLADRWMLRRIAQSSNEQLRAIVASSHWNLYQSLALLQLAARNEDVRGELPRILLMLESESELTRVYGWDALRLVFHAEAAQYIPDYNPRESTDECRRELERLKLMMARTTPA